MSDVIRERVGSPAKQSSKKRTTISLSEADAVKLRDLAAILNVPVYVAARMALNFLARGVKARNRGNMVVEYDSAKRRLLARLEPTVL